MPRDRHLTGVTRYDAANAIYNTSGPSQWRPLASYELQELVEDGPAVTDEEAPGV
jgi:hypothetical protein